MGRVGARLEEGSLPKQSEAGRGLLFPSGARQEGGEAAASRGSRGGCLLHFGIAWGVFTTRSDVYYTLRDHSRASRISSVVSGCFDSEDDVFMVYLCRIYRVVTVSGASVMFAPSGSGIAPLQHAPLHRVTNRDSPLLLV